MRKAGGEERKEELERERTEGGKKRGERGEKEGGREGGEMPRYSKEIRTSQNAGHF